MKRDQFGRDVRKLVNGTVSSNLIFELFNHYVEDNLLESSTMEESVSQFINRVADLYGLTIAENPFYKPFQKGKKRINSFSIKRMRIESQYILVKQEIIKDWNRLCWGCGTGVGRIDFSHRIPRSRRPDLIADKRNIDMYCRDRCHQLVEAGAYDLLLNGEDVEQYIKEVDFEYYQVKKIKRENNF